MTTPAIKAQFRKEEREFNGLAHHVQDMVANPHESVTVVAVLDVVEVRQDVQDGTTTPKLNIKFVEVMEGDDIKAARALLDAKYARRTGREATPDTLFDVDPNAPELGAPPVLPEGSDPL